MSVVSDERKTSRAIKFFFFFFSYDYGAREREREESDSVMCNFWLSVKEEEKQNQNITWHKPVPS
jgi:hypothetical protein